jgi:deoxyribonuclease-4
MSVAGGLPLAVDRARAHGCEAFQIFAKNASQWQGRPLLPAEAAEFRHRLREAGNPPVVSHASYLINVATADARLRQQSVDAMVDELERATLLGLRGVVLHPGCYTQGSESEGVRLAAETLVEVLAHRPRARTVVFLEHTAGHGTSIGRTFDQLAGILEHAHGHPRLRICLDTCHLLASGYDICSAEGYASTFRSFARLIGFRRLGVVHLNDSKKPLGSRVDRHEHIGQGFLGLEPFRRLVNDRRFRALPMLLETPKDERRSRTAIEVDPHDQRNLATLRGLVNGPRR